ncbi:MAG: hypothetical protein WBH00_23150 [Xanthobacteraceae bacterium]
MDRRSFLRAAATAPLTASAVAFGASTHSDPTIVEVQGMASLDEVRRIATEVTNGAVQRALVHVPAIAVKAVSDHQRRS